MGRPQLAGARCRSRRRRTIAAALTSRTFSAAEAGTRDSEFGTIAVEFQPADAEVLIDGEPWQGADRIDDCW